ncbi:MAG: protein kinase [Kiritimatiellae bacterium]|nr:protein kinase [Kiritimatiellia bacterium]
MNGNTINNDVTMDGRASVLASRYRIIRQLGAGGMGSVWLAEDTKLDNKLFAIKMLPSILVANKRAYNQLKEEALLAMKLVHPNIVQIRAFEENDNNPFLVMDYIDGETLDDWLGNGELGMGKGEGDVVHLLKPIAEALDYAHSEGVVHRDIKPANIMIRKDGRPFVMDFGIAREIQETMTRMTGKMSSGTLMYMSPEQLIGSRPEKEQDVYSFAAMVYECLKGEPPFCRGDIEYQILHIEPESLPKDISIASSVMAGLAKKPEDRPKSCLEVLGSGELSRVERVERAEVECAESDIDVGDSEAVNHTMHSSFKVDNPIVPDTPLPNLDISKHKIRRKGLKGFWGKLPLLIIFMLIALIGCGVCVTYHHYYWYKEDLHWFLEHGYDWIHHLHRSEEHYMLMVRTLCGVGLCIIGLIVVIIFYRRILLRHILLKRTQKLLTDFSRGNWNSAMNAKNVYMRDSFVLYYLGVANLYIQQNYANAEKLFSESAECGVPEALIGLGWMAENGWGKPKNMLLAQRLYREAEEQMQKRIEDKK